MGSSVNISRRFPSFFDGVSDQDRLVYSPPIGPKLENRVGRRITSKH